MEGVPLLHDLPAMGPVLPGMLGYIEYKVCTACQALRVTEVHHLVDAWHGCRSMREYVQSLGGSLDTPRSNTHRADGSSDGHTKKQKGGRLVNVPDPRGSFDSFGRLVKHGIAVTDWMSNECLKM